MSLKIQKDFATIQNEIMEIIKRSPIYDSIESVSIFGSYAKGLQKDDSDIDVLVVLNKPVGFDFLRLEYALTDKIGVKIDLIAESALSPYLKNEITKSKKTIYTN